MRLLSLALLAVIAAPAAAAPAAPAKPPPAKSPNSTECQRTTSHFARDGSMFRGGPVAPRKLTELPPAMGYMAVFRHIGGCEAPMTMVEYRSARRP